MATLSLRLFRKTSSPGVVVIRRDTDGYQWDFTNTVFSATPALDYSAPTEDGAFPGMYVLEVTQTWSGLYQLFWYPSSAKTGKPEVYSINLTSGVETDPYAALADAIWDEALSGHATAGTTGGKLTDLANADLSGLARTGADGDTLETISDQLDAAVLDGVLFLGDTQIA